MSHQQRSLRQQAEREFADSLAQLGETFDNGEHDEASFTDAPPQPQPSPPLHSAACPTIKRNNHRQSSAVTQ